MSDRSGPDPAPAPAASAGSLRSRALLVVVTGLVLAALVRGFVLESYHVPQTAGLPPIEPGDRVLVLKTDRSPEDGEVALVPDGDGGERLVPAAEATGPVVGTVLWRFWPLGRAGALPAPAGAPS